MVVVGFPLAWLIAMHRERVWSIDTIESRRKSMVAIFRSGGLATIFISFAAFALHNPISRLWIISGSTLAVTLITFHRWIFHVVVSRAFKSKLSEKYLVLSEKNKAFDPASIPLESSIKNERIKFQIMEPPHEGELEDWLVKVSEQIESELIDGILIPSSTNVDSYVLAALAKTYYLGISGIFLETPLASEIGIFQKLHRLNWVRIEEPYIVRSGVAVKRIFDIFCSLLALSVLLPFLPVIALIIKCDSRGPVFFTDRRIGKNGKLFNFPKFRTMYVNADKDRASIIGAPDANIRSRYLGDIRITRVGKFLRRWSIDEFPQFWCVLVGTMSVVGPRPIILDEINLVRAQSRYRYVCKPGLTGLWQISGRKEVAWEDRMAMDVAYIQNWQFSYDLVLIAKTFSAIATGRGAH